MQQPELGMKVAELRQQKGLTQEQLAERCEISTRTVQRIESGEVDPRLFTLNTLGEVLDFDFSAGDLENEHLWLAALHLSNLFPNVLFPLIIWSWKKVKSYKVEQHGRDVVNFQITMMLALLANVFLIFLIPALLIIFPQWVENPQTNNLIGLLTFCAVVPMIMIGVFSSIQGIINTVRFLSERPYHYPLSIKFVK